MIFASKMWNEEIASTSWTLNMIVMVMMMVMVMCCDAMSFWFATLCSVVLLHLNKSTNSYSNNMQTQNTQARMHTGKLTHLLSLAEKRKFKWVISFFPRKIVERYSACLPSISLWQLYCEHSICFVYSIIIPYEAAVVTSHWSQQWTSKIAKWACVEHTVHACSNCKP